MTPRIYVAFHGPSPSAIDAAVASGDQVLNDVRPPRRLVIAKDRLALTIKVSNIATAMGPVMRATADGMSTARITHGLSRQNHA